MNSRLSQMMLSGEMVSVECLKVFGRVWTLDTVVKGMWASPEVVNQVQMDNRRSLVQIGVRHDRCFGVLVAWMVCISPQLQLLSHHRPLRGWSPWAVVDINHAWLLSASQSDPLMDFRPYVHAESEHAHERRLL